MSYLSTCSISTTVLRTFTPLMLLYCDGLASNIGQAEIALFLQCSCDGPVFQLRQS
jgi:hypothetical protein